MGRLAIKLFRARFADTYSPVAIRAQAGSLRVCLALVDIITFTMASIGSASSSAAASTRPGDTAMPTDDTAMPTESDDDDHGTDPATKRRRIKRSGGVRRKRAIHKWSETGALAAAFNFGELSGAAHAQAARYRAQRCKKNKHNPIDFLIKTAASVCVAPPKSTPIAPADVPFVPNVYVPGAAATWVPGFQLSSSSASSAGASCTPGLSSTPSSAASASHTVPNRQVFGIDDPEL